MLLTRAEFIEYERQPYKTFKSWVSYDVNLLRSPYEKYVQPLIVARALLEKPNKKRAPILNEIMKIKRT